MSLLNVNTIPGQGCRQCFTGTVIITPTGGIGATVGFLSVTNTAIPIRQVPGPANRGVPLAQLNQQRATVCGNFIQDANGVVLNVTLAVPAVQ